MRYYKRNLWKIIFFASTLTYAAEQTVDIEINNNTQLKKWEALSSTNSPGEVLKNSAKITVNGTHPSDNTNLAAIRGKTTTVLNEGTIEIKSLEGGLGIEAIDSTVKNNGIITIDGSKNFGILGTNSVLVENSNKIIIEEYSRDVTGIEESGGKSSNKGEILVKGSGSRGMVVRTAGTQTNEKKGKIVLSGERGTAMEGKTGSISINEGLIEGSGYQSKGMASYDGSRLENTGTINLTGFRNYGIVSDNKIGDTTTANSVINTGKVNITGNSGRALVGIKVDEILNDGTVSIVGNGNIGITYTHVKKVLNNGIIILKGTSNWGFAVDEIKDKEIESVGKIKIIDSRASGAFELKGSIIKGKNSGDVTVKNGRNVTVLMVTNNGEVINGGTIDILSGESNYGIYSKNGWKSVNSGIINLNGTGGAAIYNPGGNFIQNKGNIALKGRNLVGIYYENENAGLLNTGEIVITGNGNRAFDVNENSNKVVRSVGNVLIDTTATGAVAAYARKSIKNAINDGVIKVKGTASSGLLGLDRTTVTNNGIITVNTNKSYGIQAVSDATAVNNGSVSNIANSGVAIYMGLEDSNLYMDSKSSVVGRVLSAGGVGIFHGTNISGGSSIHSLNYSLENFSHLDMKDGNFELKRNNILIAPKRKVLARGYKDTTGYLGDFTIGKNSVLTMEAYINKSNNSSNRLTSTIRANSLDIRGGLWYKPLDKIYITKATTNKIVVPNIFTNKKILGVSEKNIKVVNVVDGWVGGYELSEDKTDLSLVLTRRKGGKYLPDSYYDGVHNYPQNFFGVKYLNDEIRLDDSFKVIEKIHNAEIPYYFNFSLAGEEGNYDGGNEKGKFGYRKSGIHLKSGYKVQENLVYGIGFNELNTELHYSGSSRGNLQTYIVDTDLVYQMNELKIGGYLAASFNEHKITRGITGSNIQVKGNYNSNGLKTGAGLEYKYRLDNKNLIITRFDAGLIYNKIDGYEEEGHKDYRMKLLASDKLIPVLKLGIERQMRNNNLYTMLGVKANYYVTDTMDKRSGYYMFKPDVKYDVLPVNIPKLTVALNFRQEVDLSDRLSFYFFGKAEMGKKYWGALGEVGLTYEF
ncbi:MAG: hypothetical protein WBG30_13150 [Psychrilyobacter sp.]|uniref:hypothetical protein n=1 Tax=Psychrilyobacter sp. TaxID=2586924 RepID=UPI003C72C0E1